MKEIFAALYENDWFGIYSENHYLIFQTLFDDGGYIKLGLSVILIPLFCWLVFYYIWRYPYGKLWHWLLWLLFTTALVFAATWGIANTEIFASSNQDLIDALAAPESGYDVYAASLPFKYALFNGGLSLFISLLFSLIMKQFSKIQIHLPF